MTAQEERESTLAEEVHWFLTPGHPRRAAMTRDPFPFYARLRETAPVYKAENGPWLVTDYAGVKSLLEDPQWSRDARAARVRAGLEDQERPAHALIESGMLWRDAPDHTRLRRLVHKAFTPKALMKWAKDVDDLATELVADVADRENFDFLNDLAFKLPATVICRMIGMPAERYDDYVRWSLATIEVQEPGDPNRPSLKEADAAAQECLEYFAGLIAEKRANPTGDDVLSLMLEADKDEEVRITDEEIVGMCILLHVAGYETTSYLMSTGMYHLIENPDQYDAIANDPGLISAAIDEMLRYDGPARATMIRWATQDMKIGGTTVPAGDAVLGIFGAAHRDPGYFDRPDDFDINRPMNPHFGFGHGIHYCLGVNLAKMEAGAMFAQLLKRPRLRIAGDVEWKDSMVSRALTNLPVEWVR